MQLYQQILFLKHHFRGKWAVENVEPYYMPLLQPTTLIDRHPIWANFPIGPFRTGRDFDVMSPAADGLKKFEEYFGIVLPKGTKNARKLYRNVANPFMGAHVLKAAMREVQQPSLL
jgi:DNA (cytosine-5)-methyltransferase 1